jgi:hypothetical protein
VESLSYSSCSDRQPTFTEHSPTINVIKVKPKENPVVDEISGLVGGVQPK